MPHEQALHVGGVYEKLPAPPADAHSFLDIRIRYAEHPALVVHEPVERDPSLGAEVREKLTFIPEACGHAEAFPGVLVVGHHVQRLVVYGVLPVAPVEPLLVEVGDVKELSPGEEVVLHEADQPLHLALGERVVGLAEPRLEACRRHERLVLVVPQRAAVRVPSGDDGLHVVGQHRLRAPQVPEGMYHPYEQVLLLRVWEEFDVPLPAVVADHGEACCPSDIPVRGVYVREAPVHLVALPWPGGVASAAVPLRGHGLPSGGYEVAVPRDVDLYFINYLIPHHYEINL